MMILGWMAYALTVSLFLATSAWLLDRGLSRLRVPTRFLWLGALALSLGLPVAALLQGPRDMARRPAEVLDVGAVAGSKAAQGNPGADAGRVSAGLIELAGAASVGLDRALLSGVSLLPTSPRVERWTVGLWRAASLLLAVVIFWSMARLAVRVRRWPRANLLGREVRVSPGLGPATIGLFSPEIVVPDWTRGLSSYELELVLTHEEEHARSRDPLVLAVGLLSFIVCPWNPLIWWQHQRLRDAVEVDCDRRVLRRGVPAPRYGELLLSLRSRHGGDVLPVPTLSGSRSLLERRLTAMRKTSPRTAIPRALGAATAAIGLVVLAFSLSGPPSVAIPRVSPTEPAPPAQAPEPATLSTEATHFELHQNYPNPFNSGTTIPFVLHEGSFVDGQPALVSIRIFDLDQRLVAHPVALDHSSSEGVELVQVSYAEPGSYEALWDGTDHAGREVASGVYFMQLVVNEPPASVVRRSIYKAATQSDRDPMP